MKMVIFLLHLGKLLSLGVGRIVPDICYRLESLVLLYSQDLQLEKDLTPDPQQQLGPFGK